MLGFFEIWGLCSRSRPGWIGDVAPHECPGRGHKVDLCGGVLPPIVRLATERQKSNPRR